MAANTDSRHDRLADAAQDSSTEKVLAACVTVDAFLVGLRQILETRDRFRDEKVELAGLAGELACEYTFGSSSSDASTPYPGTPVRLAIAVLMAIPSLAGCASSQKAETKPAPARRASASTAASRAEADRRIARLELAFMEKEAQVDDLQARLDAARQEVVRAMAKLQTLATRAEAASGIAEAELALQPLKAVAGQPSAPEAAQARRLLQESSAEFEKENYGGALYLANQAKTMAAAGRGRLAVGERVAERPGETAFALPIPLKALSGGNVREGPGLGARVAFAVQPGAGLTGYSFVDEWVRISDDQGRGGWIFRGLIVRE